MRCRSLGHSLRKGLNDAARSYRVGRGTSKAGFQANLHPQGSPQRPDECVDVLLHNARKSSTKEGRLDTVKVWVEDAQETGTKSALPNLTRSVIGKTVELSGEALRESIKGFAAQFSALLDGSPVGDGVAVIDEIELSLTVSASGGLELLGKATLGTQAAIKLKLRRLP